MAENKNAPIQIGQLNLRVPGKCTDSAHRVGKGVAQRLSQIVPAGLPRHIAALSVRIQAPNATNFEMSDVIAESIANALSKNRPKNKGRT